MFASIYRDTYIEREKGETANDRNDRAIREAATWYQNHLKEQGDVDTVTVILLTNDADNRTEAVSSGIDSFTSKF